MSPQACRAISFSVLALGVGTLVPGQDPVRLLGEIREDIEVAVDVVPVSNPFTRREGPSLVQWVANRRRSSLAWSSDGQQVAYAGRIGDLQWVPVVNNDVWKVYDFVNRPVLAGGRVFFHLGRQRTASRQEHRIWIDGQELAPEDWIYGFSVDASGEQVAYWNHPGARVGNAEQTISQDHFLVRMQRQRSGRWSISRSRRSHDAVAITPPLFRAEGNQVLSFAYRESGFTVVERYGRRERELSDRFPEMIQLAASIDGRALAYLVGDGTGNGTPEVIFKDRNLGPSHPWHLLLAVDASGEHVAYVASRNERATVAIDSEPLPAPVYDHILELAFAPDGSRLAFAANDGGTDEVWPFVVTGGDFTVVVRTSEGDEEWQQGDAFLEVRDLVWSADGTNLAYGARTERGWQIVCGELHSDAYDDVGPPVFEGDGESIGFGARVGRELLWMSMPLN